MPINLGNGLVTGNIYMRTGIGGGSVNNGGITLAHPNINGITYVIDGSGNLDSSSNFIYDGSGVYILSSVNSTLNALQVQNENDGIDAATEINIKNNLSTSTIQFTSSSHTTGTTIDDNQEILTIKNDATLGCIALLPSDKTLIGYSSNTKAFEISSLGAMSFDTSNNSGLWVSNYGISGQVLASQGSSAPPQWIDIATGGGILMANPNVNGVAYVVDASGNLDSSSNFVYDGSGIQITSTTNSALNSLQLQNTNNGTSAMTELNIKNSTNTGKLQLKSTGYTAGTTIDAKSNMLSVINSSGSVNINSGDKTLIGYSSNTKAFEISSSGAMSFDTSNNSGTWVSNYGTSGQVLASQGSGAPPQWIDNLNPITVANPNVNGVAYVVDVSGNLDSSSNFVYDGSGIQITSTTNSALNVLQIKNTSTGASATTELNIKNSTNTGKLQLKSTGYTDGTTIDAKSNMLSLVNSSGSVNINSGDKTLIGYSSNTKAFEISSLGAMSFDTSNNSGTWVSNYGTSGQVLASQGSGAPPRWINNTGGSGGGILMANSNINGIPYVIDGSGNLDTSSNFFYDGSGGVHIRSSTNSQFTGLEINNTSNANISTAINLKAYNLTSSIIYNSSNYISDTTIYNHPSMFTIKNFDSVYGCIALVPKQKILFGYGYVTPGSSAVEISQFGAMSFNTYYDLSDNVFVSNYGTSGQILSSHGAGAPPQWIDNTGGGAGVSVPSNSILFSSSGSDISGNAGLTYDGVIANCKLFDNGYINGNYARVGDYYYESTILLTIQNNDLMTSSNPIDNSYYKRSITAIGVTLVANAGPFENIGIYDTPERSIVGAFNGVSSYISASNNQFNLGQNGGTIELFFKISDETLQLPIFVLRDLTNTGNQIKLYTGVDKDFNYVSGGIGLAIVSGGTTYGIWDTTGLSSSTWYYFALSIQSSSSYNVYFGTGYPNKTALKQTISAPTLDSYTTPQIVFGSNLSGDAFGGLMSNIRVTSIPRYSELIIPIPRKPFMPYYTGLNTRGAPFYVRKNIDNELGLFIGSNDSNVADIVIGCNSLTFNGGSSDATNIIIGNHNVQNVTTSGIYKNNVIGYNNAVNNSLNNVLGSDNDLGSYSNCAVIGNNTDVTGSNKIQLGDSSTTTYAYGSVQDRSDIRDKADIVDIPIGLDFINKLKPKFYRWNYREDYILHDSSGNLILDSSGNRIYLENDGTKKRIRNHAGLIAQEVKQSMDESNIDFGIYQDHMVKGGKDVKTLGYNELIPVLIKAVQELTAKNTELENRIQILENK
jgi:hypothetical protein